MQYDGEDELKSLYGELDAAQDHLQPQDVRLERERGGIVSYLSTRIVASFKGHL